MTTVLLLGHNQPICRSNAIPALTKVAPIQRREALAPARSERHRATKREDFD